MSVLIVLRTRHKTNLLWLYHRSMRRPLQVALRIGSPVRSRVLSERTPPTGLLRTNHTSLESSMRLYRTKSPTEDQF